ncbi:hypothetical protein [Williamsia serinedens]|uniref:hypothetical protein n=1 Tax=Williamsia serinedens TaxID=391736 RepID=UPI0020A558CF|nr:hypothetical protein [Williamsia serinedens]
MSSLVERALRRAVSDAVPTPSARQLESWVTDGAPAAARCDVSFVDVPAGLLG